LLDDDAGLVRERLDGAEVIHVHVQRALGQRDLRAHHRDGALGAVHVVAVLDGPREQARHALVQVGGVGS